MAGGSRTQVGISNAKFLVTGGAGFIGSHTVDALVDASARVVVVDDLSTGRAENVNPAAALIKMNLADPSIEDVMEQERPDVIYHFAYYVLVPRSTEDPLLDLDVLGGTLRMLRKAKDIGVKKVVFSSSGFVYGNNPNLPVAEDAPIDPVSPYVVSKVAIENYLRFFAHAHGLSRVVLRYSAGYGPRQVTGAMADYIRKLRAGEQADFWGDGTKTRDYVFIDDIVRANLLALDVPDDHPDPVFNIGTGVETRLIALYERLAGILGCEPRPSFHPDRVGEQMRYALDTRRARRQLGWEPAWSLDQGLQRTVEATLPGVSR